MLSSCFSHMCDLINGGWAYFKVRLLVCSLSGEQVDPVPKHFKYEENECKPHPSQPFRAGGLGRRRKAGFGPVSLVRGGVDLGQQHGDCVVPTAHLQGLLPSRLTSCGPVWERAWSPVGRSNSQKPSSKSRVVVGGGIPVAPWTTAQIAQLNNKQRDARQIAPRAASLADWVEPFQFWQAWP